MDHHAAPEHVPSIPESVVRAVTTRWHERGLHWCRNAPTELAQLCKRYEAKPSLVMPGRYGFIVAVNVQGGRSLVMRSTADPDGPRQARVLSRLADLGISPRVYETFETKTATWTVMEKLQPGAPANDASLEELANVMRPLLGQPPENELPSLADWLVSRLKNGSDQDLAPGRTAASRAERAAALATLDNLVADAVTALCHGDTSPGNVLRSDNRLMLVDPRGVNGEGAYDVAVAALKTGHDPRRLADLLQIDRERVAAWSRVAVAARV